MKKRLMTFLTPILAIGAFAAPATTAICVLENSRTPASLGDDLVITGATRIDAIVGTEVNQQYAVPSGADGTVTFAISQGSPSLPAGMSLSTDGVLSGEPSAVTAPATYTITATDSASGTPNTGDISVYISVTQLPTLQSLLGGTSNLDLGSYGAFITGNDGDDAPTEMQILSGLNMWYTATNNGAELSYNDIEVTDCGNPRDTGVGTAGIKVQTWSTIYDTTINNTATLKYTTKIKTKALSSFFDSPYATNDYVSYSTSFNTDGKFLRDLINPTGNWSSQTSTLINLDIGEVQLKWGTGSNAAPAWFPNQVKPGTTANNAGYYKVNLSPAEGSQIYTGSIDLYFRMTRISLATVIAVDTLKNQTAFDGVATDDDLIDSWLYYGNNTHYTRDQICAGGATLTISTAIVDNKRVAYLHINGSKLYTPIAPDDITTLKTEYSQTKMDNIEDDVRYFGVEQESFKDDIWLNWIPDGTTPDDQFVFSKYPTVNDIIREFSSDRNVWATRPNSLVKTLVYSQLEIVIEPKEAGSGLAKGSFTIGVKDGSLIYDETNYQDVITFTYWYNNF